MEGWYAETGRVERIAEINVPAVSFVTGLVAGQRHPPDRPARPLLRLLGAADRLHAARDGRAAAPGS